MALGGLAASVATSSVQAQPAPKPESLRKQKILEPSNLKDFIKHKLAAIVLG